MKRIVIVHGKRHEINIREKYAPKEQVVSSKKKYNRKKKHKDVVIHE